MTIQCGDDERTIVISQGSCNNSIGISTNSIETVHDPVTKHCKGLSPCLRNKPKKFTKS